MAANEVLRALWQVLGPDVTVSHSHRVLIF